MIKGCQRDGIYIQWKEDSIFESAYFVLRAGANPCGDADLRASMLREANRIIEEGGPYPKTPVKGFRKALRSRPALFAAGVLSGALPVLLAWFFLR